MKDLSLRYVVASFLTVLAAAPLAADTTPITAGLNAPQIGATGGSQVYWGPIVTQTSLSLKGTTDTLYPQKYAGTFITGSGGSAGSFGPYCSAPGAAQSGPGTAGYNGMTANEWFCNWPVPPAPQVNFDDYKYLAQLEGNVCAGGSCYNSASSPNLSGIVDPVCTVNGQPKIWFFEGSPKFTGGTYFCGVLVSRGAVSFAGSGAGANITATPPSNAWQQYLVATPATGNPYDGSANEYPGDGGNATVVPYSFSSGGGGFNASPVTFQGYIFAGTGYSANGGTLIIGSVQFGQGAASTSGGGTIFFQPTVIFSPPPPGFVDEPIITPPGGTFSGPVSVTIGDTTSGSVIVYTTDGSDPKTSASATTATNPVTFTLSGNTTLNAIGRDPSGALKDSVTATAVFTFGSSSPSSQIQFSGSSYNVLEDAGQALITVTRTGDTSGTSTVQYAAADGTAKAGTDYSLTPGTLTFNPGDTSLTFSVTVINNNVADGSETVNLSLSQPTNATLGASQAVLTITDPPAVTPTSQIEFDAASYTVSENAGMATITVMRTVSVSGVSTIQFATQDGTAVAGQNYLAVSGTLTFADGESSKSFDVPLINDGLADGDKSLLLNLGSPSNAVLGTPNQATLTLTDAGAPSPPPPAPFISALVPYSAPVDFGSPFTMRVVGSGFDPSASQVIWNNTTSLPIVSRSTSGIDATVTPAIWGTVTGGYPVVVQNPGNVNSNSVTFTVRPIGSGNPPPYVVQQPMANPNPTYGTTTTLTVLGGTFSSGGESVLTYDWEPVGIQPNLFSFSANQSHAASTTVATFHGTGVYHFKVTIKDTVTQFTVDTNVVDVTVISKAASLVLSPKIQSVTPDQTPKITATVKDQFGNVITPTLDWGTTSGSLSVIGPAAFFTVNPTVHNVHVTAATTDNSLSDYADILVLFGSAGVGDLSQATVGPVPFKAGSGLAGVTFRGLNPGDKIRLFSTDGRLVQTYMIGNQTEQLWDLTNSNGSKVASGVYLYIIEGNGQKKEGKVVLIL